MVAVGVSALGYVVNNRKEKREAKAATDAETLRRANEIVADKEFFVESYRKIIGDLRAELERVTAELRVVRVEMAEAIRCGDERIADLEKGRAADAVVIRGLQNQVAILQATRP